MERPSISEIMNHDWYNGPVPTQEEIKEIIEAKKAARQKENYQPDAQIPSGSPGASPTGGTIWRSLGGDENVDRRVAKYYPEFKRYTQFFSTAEPDTLFNALAIYADKKCKHIDFQK